MIKTMNQETEKKVEPNKNGGASLQEGPLQDQPSKSRAEQNNFKEILEYIQKTDLEYVHIEKAGKKVTLRRSGEKISSVLNSTQQNEKEEEQEEKGPQLFSIRSPIVGRFYASMTPDRPPLVLEGGRVTAGQRVAIVEAMEIKKEVFSAVTGKVVRIFARDGDPVEYGQELFSVEQENETSE